jgi:hypothetical protein
MTDQIEFYEEQENNPLDCVEDVLNDHNWVYSRMNSEELIVEVAGKACHYRIAFLWQESLGALQLCCEYDMKISPENMDMAAQALMGINSAVWMGHFELMHDTLAPRFRQTSLIRGHASKSEYDHIEDLVEISLNQCEHYHAVFDLLCIENALNSEMLSFAMMETAGES